jgi:hypothetical protein
MPGSSMKPFTVTYSVARDLLSHVSSPFGLFQSGAERRHPQSTAFCCNSGHITPGMPPVGKAYFFERELAATYSTPVVAS